MTMEDFAIQTNGLTKMFNDNLAVNALDLQVPKGSIFGFLGLNGAGKTTTIKMLLNLIYPTSGEARVMGYDVVAESLQVRERVGYVPEEPNLYDHMKISDLVNFCRDTCKTWDMKEVGRYLDLFELPVGKKVKNLSKGMKNQLALTLALGAKPDVLILDEPTSGLDPIKTRDFFRVVVEQVAETGQTVFYSSHYLHDVERVADMVGIIHKGKIVFIKGMDDIKAGLKQIRVVFNEDVSVEGLANLPTVTAVSRQGRGYLIDVEGHPEEIRAKLENYNPLDLEIIDLNLEDIFVRYTGGGAHVK